MNELNQNQPIQNQTEQVQNSQVTKPTLPDPRDLLKAAWERYKKYWKTYILILLPLYIVAVVLAFISVSIARENPSSISFLTILFSIIAGIVGILSEVAVIYSIVKEDQQISVAEAYQKGIGLFWKFLLVQIIVGVIVMLGFIALVLPGIYLAVRYAFSALTMVDEGKRGMAALNRSRDLVKGRWWEVFIRFVFLGVLSLIPFLALIFIDANSIFGQILQNAISLALAPLWILYIYGIYKALKQTAAAFLTT